MVDWRAMTTRQIWAALTTAPKVAGPWFKGEDDRDMRHHVLGEPVVFDTGHGYKIVGQDMWAPFHDDREAADSALRAQGWLLVDV